jgi:hypothetical protein
MYIKLPSKFQMGLGELFSKKFLLNCSKFDFIYPSCAQSITCFFRREKNILRMKKFCSFLHDHLLQYVLDTFLVKNVAKKIFKVIILTFLNFFVFNIFFLRSAATASGNFCQFELHILIGNILLYSYKNF